MSCRKAGQVWFRAYVLWLGRAVPHPPVCTARLSCSLGFIFPLLGPWGSLVFTYRGALSTLRMPGWYEFFVSPAAISGKRQPEALGRALGRGSSHAGKPTVDDCLPGS